MSDANKVLVLRRREGRRRRRRSVALTLSTSDTINPAEEFKVA